MQRRLYNNFYVKPELNIQNFSDKSNSKNVKSCECTSKNTSCKLSLWNKVHDNYLDNLKEGYARFVGICAFSSLHAGAFAKATTIKVTAGSTIAFYICGIAALVLILIAVVFIILYIYLLKERKNSWKHECKKHFCT